MTDNAKDRMMMETAYWWGVPTLFRAPYDPDPANADIALVGVPHSSGNGSTERDQHLGPRAVRHVSAHNRRYNVALDLAPFEVCRINDLGDVPLPEAMNNEACIEKISAFFRTIGEAGARPVSIGGDHSITGAIVQAIAGEGCRLTGGRKAAFLHLDAHTDTFYQLEHYMGARKSAGHWGAYLVQQGNVDATRSVQIGIRGNTRTRDWLETSHALGYEVVTMARYREIGLQASVDLIRKRLGDMPVYITFDLDCLDPTIAPAVSNLEAGVNGFTIDEALTLVRAARGLNVIGGDVVCLMPTKDSPNNITAMVAAAVAYEIVSLIAERHKPA